MTKSQRGSSRVCATGTLFVTFAVTASTSGSASKHVQAGGQSVETQHAFHKKGPPCTDLARTTQASQPSS
eukprot:6246651-Alexandrium_andersonii.AAC.1